MRDVENGRRRVKARHGGTAREAKERWRIARPVSAVKVARYSFSAIRSIFFSKNSRRGSSHLRELDQLLARSKAAEPFKRVVRSLYQGHAYDPSPLERVRLDRPVPRV